MIDTRRLPLAKPRPHRLVKAARDRQGAKRVGLVRAACVLRDGDCRLARFTAIGPCDGASEWAHFGDLQRWKTRGRPVEERHTTAGSLMLCGRHHDDYDEHRLDLEALTGAGCDGRLRLRTVIGDEGQGAKRVGIVRAACVLRDGDCRLARFTAIGPCDGASEWAHFGDLQRWKTRGRPVEERHTTAGSLMLCGRHHDDYDEHRLDLEALTGAGCDGRLRLRTATGDEDEP